MKHVYVGAAVIGAVIGLCLAIPAVVDIHRPEGGYGIFSDIMKCIGIAIILSSVIYGAIYGVASAAFRASKINGRGALIGKKLGLGWALCAVVCLCSTDELDWMGDLLFPYRVFVTAIFLLAVPVGALCGAALEESLPALSICKIWCIEKVSNICEKGNRVLDPKARRAIELVSLASLIGIVSTFILAYM